MLESFEETRLTLKQDIDSLYDECRKPNLASITTIRDRIQLAYQQHLTSILHEFFQVSATLPEDEFVSQLSTMLKSMNETFPYHTENPDSPHTNLQLKLAHWICEYDQAQGNPTTLLSILFPSIQATSLMRTNLNVIYYQEDTLEEIKYSVPDFNETIQSVTDSAIFKQILYTHYLANDHEHLIPIALVLELTLDSLKKPLIKPYIPATKESETSVHGIPIDKDNPINKDPNSEFNRLIQHTNLTRAVLNTKVTYEAKLKANQYSLTNKLRELAAGLKLGGVEGRGTEYEAKEEALVALVNFRKYYEQLRQDIIKQIPGTILEHIKNAFTLGSDINENDLAKITIEVKTCVNLMQEGLNQQIMIHEKALNKLGIMINSDPKALKAIADAKKEFTQAKQALYDAISTPTYQEVAQAELKQHKRLDKQDYSVQAIQALGIKTILDLGPPIKDIQDFKQLMTPLQPNLQALFYQEIESYLPKFIKTIKDCKKLIEFVKTTNQACLPDTLLALKTLWPTLIRKLDDFRQIERFLSGYQDQIKTLITVIRPKLITWIKTPDEYQQTVKKHLSHDEHLDFLNQLEQSKPSLWIKLITKPFLNTLSQTITNSIHGNMTLILMTIFNDAVNRLCENNVFVKQPIIGENEFNQILTEYENTNSPFTLSSHIKTKCNLLKETFITKNLSMLRLNNQIHHNANLTFFLKTLFSAQPWIKQDPSSDLVKRCLEQIFLKYFNDHLIVNDQNVTTLNDLATLTKEQMITQFSWREPTKDWIKPYADIYPYSRASERAYDNPSRTQYPSLAQYLKHTTQNWLNHGYSRTDVLRYLRYYYRDYQNYREQTYITEDEEKHPYLGIKIIMLAEVDTLTPTQREKFKLLIINLGHEAEPLWIGLQHKNQDYTLYEPAPSSVVDITEVRNRIQEAYTKLSTIFPTIKKLEIKYDDNLILNDFNADLTANTIWNTILFARIVPTYLEGAPIHQRQYEPFYLMLYKFYDNCGCDDVMLHRFVVRYPLNPVIASAVVPPSPYHSELIGGDDWGGSYGSFTCGFFKFKHDGRTYVISTKEASTNLDFSLMLLVGLKILHWSPLIKKLCLSKSLARWQCSPTWLSNNLTLLRTNPNLLYVDISKIPEQHRRMKDLPVYLELSRYAARNRFLQINHPTPPDHNLSIQARKDLDKNTGQQLLHYFQSETAKLNIADIKAMDAFNKSDDFHSTALSKAQHLFRQWRDMGTLGLTYLFEAISQSPDRPPALHATFHLDPFTSSHDVYIKTLTEHINLYPGKKPLFQSISLILPVEITGESVPLLLELLTAIKEQMLDNREQPNEICLYHVKLDGNQDKNLILSVLNLFNQTLTRYNALRHPIIQIPEWDESAPREKTKCSIKAAYHNHQNHCLAVWRASASETIAKALRPLSLLEQADLHPTILLNNTEEQQPWGEEKWTVLADTDAAQCDLQESTQEQEQQQITHSFELKPPPTPEEPPLIITPITITYPGQDKLITRDNIDEDPTFLTWWQGLSNTERQQYGSSGKELFSRLFGRKRAAYLIEMVELKALVRLFPHIPQLLGGFPFEREHQPAGFELYFKSKIIGNPRNNKRIKDIVLGFSPEKEKTELAEQALKKPMERNPYALQLTTIPNINYFKGDFLQFATISTDLNTQLTLHQFLATEEPNPTWDQNACQNPVMHGVDEIKRRTTYARYEVDQNITPPKDHQDCLTALKQWLNDPTLDDLFDLNQSRPLTEFDSKHPPYLTEQNLKSLGQLFYQLGAEQGLKHFFRLAHQVKAQFGEDGFRNWKAYCLDPNPNWRSCLDEAEVEALSLSMCTISKNKTAQTIWWLLIKTHGTTMEYMPYHSLWYAYQQYLAYLNRKDLTQQPAIFKRTIDKMHPFNGQVFLKSLHARLYQQSQMLGGHKISQHLLDHLDQADLTREGPNYAIFYENYPYNDNALNLQNFEPTAETTLPTHTYAVHWPYDITIIAPVTHALRYATERARFSLLNLEALKAQLTPYFETPSPQKHLILRLYMACITSGINQLSTTQRNETYIGQLLTIDDNLLLLINRGMPLPDVVEKNRLALDWQDLFILANTITQLDLVPLLNKLTDTEVQNLIQACGRALQCYRSLPDHQEELHLYNLLDTIKTKTKLPVDPELGEDAKPNWAHPLLQHYPWLMITDKTYTIDGNELPHIVLDPSGTNEQLMMFQQQLDSIDFKTSTKLPTANELILGFEAINNAPDQAAHRRALIRDWEINGTQCTRQGTKYSPLTEDETTSALRLLHDQLKPYHQEETEPLCEKFFTDYLALPTLGKRQEELTNLLNLFCQVLDNKEAYNEVGIILGYLINQAKATHEEKPKRYATQFLTEILKLLIQPDHYKIYPYPIRLLDIFLRSSIAKTLLSSDLNGLEQGLNSTNLQHFIEDLIQNKDLSLASQEIALDYATQDDSEDHRSEAEMAKNLLTILSANKNLKKTYVDMIHQLLKEHRLPRNQYTSWQIKHIRPFELIQDPTIRAYWQDMQIKWSTQVPEAIKSCFPSQEQLGGICVQIILVQLLSKDELKHPSDDVKAKIIALKEPLLIWSFSELKKLMDYCDSDGRLTIDALHTLLTDDALHTLLTDVNSLFKKDSGWGSLALAKRESDWPYSLIAPDIAPEAEFGIEARFLSANRVISFFEFIYIPRRIVTPTYSITEDEQNELIRVLSGLKHIDGRYFEPHKITQFIVLLDYCNAFTKISALDAPHMDAQAVKDLATISVNQCRRTQDPQNKNYYKMEILACIRQMSLAKQTAWLNHLQMIALIEVVIQDDASKLMLLEIATGEGKSLILEVLAIFYALFNKKVDIASSKDILAERDYQKHKNLIAAFGLPTHEPIHAQSALADHETPEGTGHVHHYYLGHFALNLAHLIIYRKESIDLLPKDHILLIDEMDEVVFEGLPVVNNYAKQKEPCYLYPYDRWLLRVVCNYYAAHRAEIISTKNQSGQVILSNLKHLKPLCEYIIGQAKKAPEQSRFIQETFTPALKGTAESMKERDRVLEELLTACHIAYKLVLDIHFCVGETSSLVGEHGVLTKQKSYPIMGCQIKENSTYARSVQQFIDEIQNINAIKNYQTPSFMPEPAGTILLSLNTVSVSRNLFERIIGVSATVVRDPMEPHYYSQLLDVEDPCVIALPTFHKPATTHLPIRFASNKQEQIKLLGQWIMENPGRDYFIACKHDAQVKQLTKEELKQFFKEQATESYNPMDYLLIDTVDQRTTETQMLEKIAQKYGLASARIGRGTHRETSHPEGMHVMLMSLFWPRETDQIKGRQGRYGSPGSTQSIINYKEIELEQDKYLNSTLKDKFEQTKQECRDRLQQDCREHADDDSPWWQALKDETYFEQFLVFETIQLLTYRLNLQKNMTVARRNTLISDLSLYMLQVHSLNNCYFNANPGVDLLLSKFAQFITESNLWWSESHTDSSQSEDEQYLHFLGKVNLGWQALCDEMSSLDKTLMHSINLDRTLIDEKIHKATAAATASNQPAHLAVVHAKPTPLDESSEALIMVMKMLVERIGDSVPNRESGNLIFGDPNLSGSYTDLIEYMKLLQNFTNQSDHANERLDFLLTLLHCMESNIFFTVRFKTHCTILQKYENTITNTPEPETKPPYNPNRVAFQPSFHWLPGLMTYFRQSILGDKKASQRTEAELLYINDLTTLIIQVITTEYCAEESPDESSDATQQFIRALTETLGEQFSNDPSKNRQEIIRDLMNRLHDLLTTDKTTTNLLTQQLTEDNRLSYIVRLLHQVISKLHLPIQRVNELIIERRCEIGAVLLRLRKAPPQKNDWLAEQYEVINRLNEGITELQEKIYRLDVPIASLIDHYLTTKTVTKPIDDVPRAITRRNALYHYPEVIPFLFDIIFRNNEDQDPLPDLIQRLPDVCPSCFSDEEDAKTITYFWGILAHHATDRMPPKADIDKFIKLLNQYETPSDRHNILKALHTIADAVPLSRLNELIEPSSTSMDVSKIIESIKTFSTQAAATFHALLRKKKLIVQNGAYWHPKNLNEYFVLSKIFQNLSAEDSHYFLSQDILASFNVDEIDMLLSAFDGYKITVTGSTLEKSQIEEMLRFYQTIKEDSSIINRAPFVEIFKTEYSAHPKQFFELHQEKFKTFMAAIKTLRIQEPITENTILHLWDQWKNKALETTDRLEQIVELLKIMQQHTENPAKFDEFFELQVNEKTRNQRILLFQCLTQKLIRVEAVVGKTYFDKLTDLNNHIKLTKDGPTNTLPFFQGVFRMTQELWLMSQKSALFALPDAYMNIDKSMGTFSSSTGFELRIYFQKKQKEYNACFFKSHSRKTEAQALFSNLNTANFLSDATIPAEAITNIIRTKEAIIQEAGEQSSWYLLGRSPIDSKGYSRLHRICSDLLATTIKHYLTQTETQKIIFDVNDHRKQKLYEILEAHYIKEIDVLVKKLPNKKELCQTLSDIKKTLLQKHTLTESESNELFNQIQTGKKTLPKHLHYLLDDMLILCEFTNLNEPAQSLNYNSPGTSG